MAEAVVVKISKREGRGTRKAQQLRKQGLVPAIVYGHEEAPESVSTVLEDLEPTIRHGVRIVDLDLDGKVQKALIKEVQWDYLGKEILHVDFTRVAAGERVHISVAIELRGTAPGTSSGGVLDQPLHSLHVECPAISVPESIRVNISSLQVGGAIHVRDVTLPADVVAMDDPDAVIVHVTEPAEEPEEGAEAGAQAEPEIITRRPAEEKEAE